MIKLTVLMPVYNTHPANLMQAFYSIYNQKGVKGYEVLIVNDGSDKPETLMVLDMLSRLERVTVINHEERKGSSAARNTGLRLIETDYVALMDSDDISASDRLKVQLAYMEKHKPDVLGTNLFSFYDGDFNMTRIFRSKHLEVPEYNNGWMVNQGTVIYRRKAVIDIGGYDERLLRAQDIDLWKRLFKSKHKFRNITTTMYAWRRYRP